MSTYRQNISEGRAAAHPALPSRAANDWGYRADKSPGHHGVPCNREQASNDPFPECQKRLDITAPLANLAPRDHLVGRQKGVAIPPFFHVGEHPMISFSSA